MVIYYLFDVFLSVYQRLSKIKTRHNSIEDSLDFWLAAVLVHAPDARFIIVGSHDAWRKIWGQR